FVIASPRDAAQARVVTGTLPGVEGRRTTVDVPVDPTAVNGTPFGQIIGSQPPAVNAGRERSFSAFLLTGVEGYELRAGVNPGVTAQSGRTLTAADSGTTNV